MTSGAGATVEFCGESYEIGEGEVITVGRDADLVVDDNPFLHRCFLTISVESGLCLVSNVGDRLSATASDLGGQMEAFLAPGATLPLVFATSRVSFAAGSTVYELLVHNSASTFQAPSAAGTVNGDTTLGPSRLTPDQRRLVVALAEPQLIGDLRTGTTIPTSKAAALRLGWPITKFNRKLDNVCEKLDRVGVRGLHGAPGALASNRRARLVEYAVATRLVTGADLELLDSEETDHAEA